MRAIVLLFLSLAACEKRTDAPLQRPKGTVQWKAAYTDAECKRLTEPVAVLQRCFGGKSGDENYVGDLQCMPYSAPQRLTGVWVVGLEYSGFFPNAASYTDTKGRGDDIWLQAKPSPSPEVTAAGQGGGTRAYAVELIGRRSLCDFHYGHMGMSPHEIIAQSFAAMRPLSVRDR